jgi:hypothetical protein
MTSVYAYAMQSTRYVVMEKNLLIGAGAYYLSGWLGMPLALGFGKLTQRLIYSGDFNGYVVGPLVMHLPRALVAAAAGATVVWLVESDRPVGWAIFPALLYGLLGFLGYHWARPPLALDRVAQTIGALFPALACIVGALIAGRRRETRHASQTTPW